MADIQGIRVKGIRRGCSITLNGGRAPFLGMEKVKEEVRDMLCSDSGNGHLIVEQKTDHLWYTFLVEGL